MACPPTTAMNALGPMPPEYDTVTEAGLGRFIMYADIARKLKDLTWKELFTNVWMRCLGTTDADDASEWPLLSMENSLEMLLGVEQVMGEGYSQALRGSFDLICTSIWS